MRRPLAVGMLLVGLPLSAVACLWDRDTPADEARGLPEVVAAITGRFPRNPPLYSTMRLERVTAHLAEHPDDLAAHDDAGVACDRLGQGDAAIAWMARKREQLDRLDASRPEVREQAYRYHANLGTFLVHRWIRSGADRARLDEVRDARHEIRQALALNPQAHFGREAYQLRALEWLLDPPSGAGAAFQPLPNLLGWPSQPPDGPPIDPKTADDAVRGLAGLVVLGDAWESVDVFYALAVALQSDSVGQRDGRNTLAYLAWLRAAELVDAGRGSLLPDAPRGPALKERLARPPFVRPQEFLDATYRSLRTEADAWQADRTAFLLRGLHAGRHPDTDPHFWDGFVDRAAPPLPRISVPTAAAAERQRMVRRGLALVIGVPAALVALIGFAWHRQGRRARRDLADGAVRTEPL